MPDNKVAESSKVYGKTTKPWFLYKRFWFAGFFVFVVIIGLYSERYEDKKALKNADRVTKESTFQNENESKALENSETDKATVDEKNQNLVEFR